VILVAQRIERDQFESRGSQFSDDLKTRKVGVNRGLDWTDTWKV